jgi:hypothetical protein
MRYNIVTEFGNGEVSLRNMIIAFERLIGQTHIVNKCHMRLSVG